MTTTRRPIVGGNWKMNTDLATAVELAEDIVASLDGAEVSCDVALFPPHPYLQAVGKTLGNHAVLLGAQDVWPEPNGAFTGEVSVTMLTDLDAECVIVGHSERRHVIGETDELINRKAIAAINAGLTVVSCIGETRIQREAAQTEQVVLAQLAAGLTGIDAAAMQRVVIAYEPVWAIGTGLTAEPADAQAVHEAIRIELGKLYDNDVASATRIQYGGSVKPANAGELIAQPDIDGFLVGGASLSADSFVAIVRSTLGAPRASAASC